MGIKNLGTFESRGARSNEKDKNISKNWKKR